MKRTMASRKFPNGREPHAADLALDSYRQDLAALSSLLCGVARYAPTRSDLYTQGTPCGLWTLDKQPRARSLYLTHEATLTAGAKA
jgi:hypothetical protein